MNRLNVRSLKGKLEGKTVVLTGASRGIGAEISQVFAQQGAHLIGIARSQSGLDRWANDMARFGIQATGIAFDLSQTEKLPELARKIERCAQSFSQSVDQTFESNGSNPGQIDIVINNAGVEIYRAFSDYSLEEIETVIRVNLLAAMTLTRLLLPSLSSNGHIVNMASLASKKGHPYDSAYAASKAGLLMWGNSLRQELANSDIQREMTVTSICPGYVVDTGMLADTGIKAPLLAGRSRAQSVATATLKAVLHKRAEVIINQDPLTETLTRVLLALEQIFPRVADFSNRALGITQANQQRINPKKQTPPTSQLKHQTAIAPPLIPY